MPLPGVTPHLESPRASLPPQALPPGASPLSEVTNAAIPVVEPPIVLRAPAIVNAAKASALKAEEDKAGLIEAAKKLAAFTAVDRHLRPEHKKSRVLMRMGAGSTVPYVVERIVMQGVEANKGRVFIPSGFQSKELIVTSKLLLGDVDQYPQIDVTFDGADEVDKDLNCVKGGGACHLREKVIAEAAETFILVADYRKNSDILGRNFKAGVPIEVAPFAYAKLLYNLHTLGSPQASLRMAKAKAGPVVSDNGNFIIDAPFPEEIMREPYKLLQSIKMLTGVVEVGLFCHMARAAYFGNPDGSVTVRYHDGRIEHVAKDQASEEPVADGSAQ
ncbi:hypothetical protein PUNSTDRAFT_107172 [Punctularia strigosozonata HHB-11173 SS5]|uniref:uncharacterized protein n=1 Tax=Punctularia strigosozonata (strain HHB-11173) TaxID=741275 RepID=UPI0004417019|nr:uncharacterized protein PUNSTDRAFT_107172 [Punctularia strigosozonata HHB-11173 SS5]EIN05488.1 hypothetical protein PUNSTDRAFT_107172 [Punctularia strigosozonata HHB-11173 SS5]